MKIYRDCIKRVLGLVISLVAIICLSPVFIIVTIWLHFANKGAGAFFLQERPGKDGKIFKIIKYKSMTDECDENGVLLPNEKRITKIGALVRKLSIDELPQLINVFKGDMALVGPRPLLKEYLPYYTKREALRHSVRPGITGWAQVNGRNEVGWDERLEYDAYYVENISFLLDCKIILRTVINVLKHKDVQVVPQGEPLNIARYDRIKKDSRN